MLFIIYASTGLLLYVSEGKPFMPPLLLPSKYKHNYTATIRVVTDDQLGTRILDNVQFKVGQMSIQLRFVSQRHNILSFAIS